MEEQLLICRCGASAFYMEKEGGGLVFFKIAATGKPIFDKPEDAESTRIDESTIFCCTACAWEGTIAELRLSGSKTAG